MGDYDEDTGAVTCCSTNGRAVVGRIMDITGTGASQHVPTATFLRAVMLVR
jgi:hypothetical protein